jgi:hypothetical protein
VEPSDITLTICDKPIELRAVARFQVLKAMSMNTAVFWAIIALMTKAASTSEKSVNFYQTTRHNSPEDSHLHRAAGVKGDFFIAKSYFLLLIL